MEPLVGESGSPSEPRRRRWPWIVGVLAVLVMAVGSWIGLTQIGDTRPVPSFPSLADQPDPSLQGTVAYVAPNGCVRLVAAAGSPSEEVYCLPDEDTTQTPRVGKEVGPQLVWLPDGRLEITVFRMDPSDGADAKTAPGLIAGWQQILDVRTGDVEDVPAEEVPGEPNLGTEPTVSPDGERITIESDTLSGEVEVILSSDGDERTLLEARSPGKYQYELRAFWAPNWRWIAADDGRILVITPDDPSTTRVLVDELSSGRSGGTVEPSFAVTADEILTP